MPLPWVKVHFSLLDNDVYRAITGEARLTFLTLLPLAQKLDMNGAIATRMAPLSVAEIAYYTGLNEPRQRIALDLLVRAAFVSKDEDGPYMVERFAEFQHVPPSTERVKRHRDVKRDETFQKRADAFQSLFHETLLKRDGNANETTREAFHETQKRARGNALDTDTDTDTLTSFVSRWRQTDGEECACASQRLGETWSAESVAVAALGIFGNRRSESAQGREFARWASALRDMRSRQHTWQAIWNAFARAHADGKHAPIHGLAGPWNNLRAAAPSRPGLRVVGTPAGPYDGVPLTIAPEDRDRR